MTAIDTRARILVIEDDPAVASLQVSVLARAGYRAETAHTGRAGLRLVLSYKPDVVLVDIGLPDMSGLEVCTTIAETADAYILVVSGQADDDGMLASLGFGADDVISKPFSPSDLVARVGAFLRRRERLRSRDDGRLPVGDAVLVRERHTLERDGRSVGLTALEFRLLWHLGDADGKLLTRAQIPQHVWDDVSGIPTRVVDVHVAALRRKAGDIGAQLSINSVRGIGYRLDGV